MILLASLFDGLWEVLRGFSVLFLFSYLTWAIANKFEVARAKATARKHTRAPHRGAATGRWMRAAL